VLILDFTLARRPLTEHALADFSIRVGMLSWSGFPAVKNYQCFNDFVQMSAGSGKQSIGQIAAALDLATLSEYVVRRLCDAHRVP
jgi:hypothetical protein